jgi:tyrosine-protein phosphatase SIW14
MTAPRPKRTRGPLCLAMAVAAAAVAIDAALAQAPARAPVRAPAEAPCENFGQVGPDLYRGAEPDDTCLDHLAARGVRTIVNLRDERDAAERERLRAAALGMTYVNLPMSGFGRPALPEVRTILAALLAPGAGPVFVHCKRGRDRTGVVVAAYRMAHDGWTAGRAIDEAKRFGMAWWQFRMKGFIEDFDGSPES